MKIDSPTMRIPHAGAVPARSRRRSLPLDWPVNRVLKRLIDQFIAAAVLALAAPLMVAVAALVRADSPGPVIYRRRVTGRHGVEFDAFKFRTMVADAARVIEEDPQLRQAFEANYKLQRDPRVTSTGRILRKFSLDELPQLINVLTGQMSIVGPRMLSPEETGRYGAHISTVLGIKPGLTGLWQVSGRQKTTYERRIELDVHYVDHWSLLLDLRILLRTPWAVIRGTGAY